MCALSLNKPGRFNGAEDSFFIERGKRPASKKEERKKGSEGQREERMRVSQENRVSK
jgi:hypothetical protein